MLGLDDYVVAVLIAKMCSSGDYGGIIMNADSMNKIPKVFISYSWSSSDRVLELAERLMANGVDVILDKWDLKEGQDKYAFMEQSVTNPEVYKVLIICDKAYADKANKREGGVGDETVIISPEVYGHVEQEKFIPIIFEVDENANPYLPTYIKSRIYIDLSTEDDRYEVNYETLLRNIHNKPLYRKPSIGAVPEWLNNESVDLSTIRDLIKQTRGYAGGNKTKADFLIRKCNDEFIVSLLSIEKKTDIPSDEALLIQIDEEKTLRDLFIDYIEAVLYSDLPVESIVPFFFEQAYNTTHDASGQGSYSESDFELYDFALWEMMICTVAVLLHYEKYYALHQILTHTYFFRQSYFDARVKNFTYAKLRKNCYTIENACKPKCDNPKYFTLTGEILAKREKKSIITKNSLANADIVLFQMFSVLGLEDEPPFWFPVLYYHIEYQLIWQKLKSKAYCEKIMPLFGVKNIEELKQAIERNTANRDMHHRGAFTSAPIILHSINLDEIGSIN